MRKLLSPLPFLFFLLFFLVETVYAPDVNLQDVDNYLGAALGIGTFAGGIFASIIFMMVCILPTALISRKTRVGFLPELIMGFVSMGACIAIGWLPYWFLLIFSILIALMFAGAMRGFITGSGKTE